ncbi:nesprin-2-like isoform X4 [Solea solea]|uniref:nesprin-2-like isoform X4 n=1 Tax=Solea solea TaxID=90069 RepID=UPI00272C2E30|nr:nesprin-2-like isoform X4 [Solea solea]
MASGGAEEEDGGIPLDIDNVHMLLQVEQEQIQKRTFTNWINAQLAKRCPPSFVSDLFSDLRDGSQLLDLLEVMSGQCLKRQRGHGVFQQRTNIETALTFLKKKSIKLVNINIPDIIDGRPSIILGLVWTIILHCHIEELASALSFSSRHSSLDSLTSLDSWTPGSPVPASPVPTGRTSPLHRRFRVSAKKALLMWVRDQCQRVGSSVSVKDFKSSWRSGEAFLVILCSLRPQLVDLSLVQSRSNQENLEEAFHLAERELHIPPLLEPQDVDVKDPDEKSIMTYVAQFLQYSNDMPAPDDHLQLFPLDQPFCFSPVNLPAHFTPAMAVSSLRQVPLSERAHEVTSWLQQSFQELSESWMSTENSGYAEKYQVFQNHTGSFSEQRRHVMSLLSNISRRPELSRALHDLRAAWDRMEDELQRCKAELDLILPPPLDSVVSWLQRAEAALTEGGRTAKDHADIAKEARAQQETLKTLIDEMSHYVKTLDNYNNMDDSGNMEVPVEKFDEIKRRVTHIRVTTKYHGIKLEYREYRHTVLNLLNRINAKIQTWKSPYRTEEDVHVHLQDWHETVEHQGLILILMDSLQNLKEKANAYTSKAALGEDSQLVQRQVKEAEMEAELLTEAATTVRGRMERVASAWNTYSKCLPSLQTWLSQSETPSPAAGTQDMSEWTSCHAKLNEAGNFLIEATETSTSRSLVGQLSKINKCWAGCVKRTKFDVSAEPSVNPPGLQMVHSLTQDLTWLLRQPLDVASVPLNATRQKLQLLSKKLAEVDASSLSLSPEIETLPKMLAEAERSCWELQRAASMLEGRLAELDHWSSDALDCYQLLQEKMQRRRSALDSAAKVLLSRGLQLENQVVTEGRDLQDVIGRVRKSSPLQHLSASGLQHRVSEAISNCQEILGLFTSLGFEDSVRQTQRQRETGVFVVARTKHANWTENIKVQNQDPSQISPVYLSHMSQQSTRHSVNRNTQDETTIVVPTVEIQMLPQPFREPVPHFHFCESKPVMQLQLRPETHSQPLTQTAAAAAAAGLTFQKSTVLQSESQKSKSVNRGSQSPQPPVMVHSEVHLKAQSMARSRMERARVRLQEHIQQSIKLFSSREISESQAKRKKWALKILQPVVLEEFLDAAEGFGAFCSEPQLQDVMLQSETVRKQWEDVRREMAAFVSVLWSKIREGEQSFSVLTCTNALHDTTDHTDHTDHDCFRQQQQQQAVVDGAASAGERVEALRALRETVTQSRSSGLAADQPMETHGAQERRPTDTVLSAYNREQQPDLTPVAVSVPHCGETLPLRSPYVLMETQEHADAGSAHNRVQRQVQTVVSGDTVETEQAEAEWTVAPETETVVAQQEENSPEQEVLERMTYVEKTADLMESTGHQTSLVSQKLDKLITRSVDISSFRFADQNLESNLKEMNERLRKPLTQSSQEETQHPETTSLHQTPCSSVGDLQIFQQQLGNVEFAAQAGDHFVLAALSEGKAEIPAAFLAKPNTHRQQDEAEQELDRLSWQRPMQHSLQTEQSDVADGDLKAAGTILTTTVTQQEVVTSLPRNTVDVEEAKHQESNEEFSPVKMRVTETHPEQEHPPPREGEQESRLEAEVDAEVEPQREEEEQKAEGDVEGQRRRGSCVKGEGEEKQSFVQRRAAFLGALRDIRRAAEHVRLHEATLPALQLRKRALTELDSRLAGLLSELHHAQHSPQSGEVKDVWDETTRAVTERLELCCVLTELMKRFQSVRAELSGTLQRAETTISEKASYMGRENLQRLYTKVQETKAELHHAGDSIEDVRSVCRQIHTHLRRMPECDAILFESEADTLTDSWLDISERTDSHLENLRLGLTLWGGVLQLGAEVENWTSAKVNTFVQSPSFQSEDDIEPLKSEIVSQEKRVEHFERKASEIQSLLQSTDPLLELQVTGNQMRKKLEQLKELVSESEDVYRQTVAAKEQISARTTECFTSLRRIQESLLTLRGSDVSTVLAQLKDLCLKLQSQDEQAEGLIEDVQVLSSISSPHGLQSLCAGVVRLQEEVRNSHQLFSEVEERTQRNIQDLDRLQMECEQLERWLQGAEEKAAKGEDVILLQEEALKLRVRTDVLSRLVSSLQSSDLQQTAPVLESSKLLERYRNFYSVVLHGEEEKQRPHPQSTETLLEDSANLETQTSQLEAPKDSIGDGSLSHLQQHKRALDSSSITETLAVLLTENSSLTVHQVKDELSSVHAAVKDLAENVGNLRVNRDVRQLKQQWCVIQDVESRLTELASRVHTLQDSDESRVTQKVPPSEATVNVNGVTKDFDSLRSVFLQKKQECAEATANRVKEVVEQLRRWRHTVGAEPASLGQAAADEGSQLRQYLRELLADKDFLPNILGTTASKDLQKKASIALTESSCVLNALSECQITQGPNEVELDKRETHGSHSASLDEMVAVCPPEPPSLSAADEGMSESDRNENPIVTKALVSILERQRPSTEPAANNLGGSNMEAVRDVEREDISVRSFMQSAKNGALERNHVPNTKIPHEPSVEIQQLTSKLHLINDLEPDEGHTGNTDSSLQSAEHPQTLSGNKMEPLKSDSREPEPLQEDATSILDCNTSVATTHKDFPPSATEATAQPKGTTDALERLTPKTVYTIVLEMEPRVASERENVGAELIAEVSNTGFTKQRLDLLSKSLSPKSNKTDVLRKNHLAAHVETIKDFKDGQEKERDMEVTPKSVFTIVLDMETPVRQGRGNVESLWNITEESLGPKLSDKSLTMSTEVNEVQSTSAILPESPELNHDMAFNSSTCQLTAAETTFPSVKLDATDLCRTVSSVMCAVESPVQSGDTFTATCDDEQTMGADTAESAGTGGAAELTEGGNAEEASGSEGPESNKHPEVTKRRGIALLLGDDGEDELPASLEDAEETQEQPQTQEGAEPERTVLGLSTAETKMSHKSSSATMLDILSDIQSLVERGNIINRTPHIDLKWYVKSSPGEPEIRLVRTVQQVLACRYQPAQLDATAMAKQLEEAEEYRSCVQEQVSAMKSASDATDCDPNALKRAEERRSAALLEASATLQVKAAQLDQVKQYHRQMKMARALLQVLAAEKESMSLNALGCSAVQAQKLHALLQTMERKKDVMEELLHLSSQLSAHLSDAESSGALLAQLGDVQEEWRLLEGSIKRALRHAANSASQSSVLIKEAEHLKAKLEDLHKSSPQSNDGKSALELACLTTDVKLYNQLYLHLKSQSDALVHFSVGQKEKNEIQNKLQELESLLDVTKKMLSTLAGSCGGTSLTRINKQLQDLIIWAKQAENHISIGKKLALFPEEARSQIVDMKKFQTDILSQRSKMQAQIEEIKEVASDMEKEESDQVVKTVEDLYEAIADSLDHVLGTMKNHLQKREKLLSQLASLDAWLAQSHATRDVYSHVENVSKADVQKLQSELERHRLATVEIKSKLKLVEAMEESCKDIIEGLSPGESRYLVNRLSGLWTELDGLLAHEKATSWELEELIHERTSSDEELSTIQNNLKEISTDLEKQRFPLRQETLSMVAQVMHMLMENQCQVQELQHCHEAKRSALLCTIGELQDRCKALRLSAFEQHKYLHLRRQMEESRDIANEQIQRARDRTISVGERFRLCQTLLVELPLVKTQCQEAGDQLEAIAHELHPSQLNSERQRIHHTVETLVTWEHTVTDDIKNLEAKLLSGLHLSSEHPALTELFQRTTVELDEAKPVSPDEKAIDGALRGSWVIWRNMKSGMRVLKALGRKENINLKNDEELNSLIDTAIQKCHVRMECLSQARESLKDYQWAAQGAISFLHNAEATFLSAPGGFLDCTEEQRQTQQALEVLEDGFQAHMCHLVELLPRQPCLSHPEVEQLHISILSQLLVGRATLEAQAQLRLESLQRCAVRQQSHRSCHEDMQQRLSGLEARLSECASAPVTSYEKCVTQQKSATLLMMALRSLAGKIEELRAGCPMQGCCVGKDGELGALWRRWSSLRRGIGLLMAHAEQRQEEWKDITTSIRQCCSFLASLQAEVPDSSTVSFTQEKPQELLVQAEIHQAGLEQEQQALSSLEHRLEHALSLSESQDPVSPGPVGKTLVKIQENVRSLKERNLLIVAAAQEEENKRQQVQEEIEEVEKHMLTILPQLETCSNPSQRQELREDLSLQKTRLQSIMDEVQSRYAEIPDDLSQRLRDTEVSLQRAEEELMERSVPVRKLAARVRELGSGLEKVKVLLEQKSPTVSEAQNVLKRVWDELDLWHSRLMLVESEVQDLAEEQPDQAHVLMDHLTQPLQLYQNASQMAEYRTSFLSKIPACLKEFEDISYSASCWLDEAQAWLSACYSFTTAKSLQNHAKSLQLVLDDSERIRDMLQDFRPVLSEISAVCDVGAQEHRLDQNDRGVHKMQRHLLEPLEQIMQAAVMVEAMETEVKTMERNVPKIRTILSTMDDSNITLREHLHNRQVILANVQSIRRTLEDMESCRAELPLPQGEEESLLVFSRAKQLLQPLEELQELTQCQASQLENKIREEGEHSTVSHVPGEMQLRDTSSLTGQDPEDPLTREEAADVKASSETEMSSNNAEAQLLYMKPGRDDIDFATKDVDTGLKSANVGDSSCPETPATAAAEVQHSATDRHKSAKHETLDPKPHTESLQAAAAIEDTRLIPVRPITPFTASGESAEFIADGDEDLALSTASQQDVSLKEQSEIRTSHKSLEEKPQVKESSKVQFSLAGRHDEDEEEENQRWSRLHAQISQTLTAWNNVQHQTSTTSEHEQVPEKEPLSSRCASSVLQQTQESITTLRKILKSADGSDPEAKEKLYEALQKVLFCLDTGTDLLSTPDGAGEDELQLRLVQQECISAELETLADLLKTVESETRREDPDSLHGLTCLQDCLCRVQLLFTSSINRLTPRLGFKHRPQFFNQLCILDEFEVRQSETFPNLKDAPDLERCVLGRHLRQSPGERAKLQQASRASLQGITHLLEVGEEFIKERQMSQVHSLGQLQAALCRHEKLRQVLGSQLAFVQCLFRREPEVLRCQEDEWLQLEVRAKALQQQALGQDVASQRRLQEWTLWDNHCGRVGRALDEFEAFISNGEPEGDDEESVVQHSLETCQQTLVQLDESRAAVGFLLDRCRLLQTEPASFAASLVQTGGAVELRWANALRRAEQEIQRCRDIQDVGSRFHTNFASVSNWLAAANERLKSWSNPNQECVHNSVIELLDFSMEVEAMSVQRAAVSTEATQLIHLREADSPVRAQVTQLEVDWSQLTCDLSKTQDQIHKRLLARWPPVELLSDLETWMKKLQASLSREKENHLKIKDAAQINEVLHHYQELKAGTVSGQLLLDFLCQSGPRAAAVDVQVVQSERTVFAEELGALTLQLLHLQRELDSQIQGAEQMRHTCAVRERKLKRLRGWVTQQKKQLSQWKQPTSQSVARRALEEWETSADRVKEVAAALQELKASRVCGEQEEECPCDITFSNQAESVCDSCEDLRQQMEVVRPALQHTLEKWSRFERDLSEVTLNATEVLCALRHQRATLFSLKQAEGNMELLQELQRKAEKGEELWAAVEKSLHSLVKTLHGGTARVLSDQLEGEQKRWKDITQELNDEQVKMGETVSLWQEYSRLSESSSLHLKHLRLQWEELLDSSQSPEHDKQTVVDAVEKLQEVAERMQTGVSETLDASEPLAGRLEPLAANLIQSESRLLSRDALLLTRAMAEKKKSLQEDLQNHRLFHTFLLNLEKQTQNIKDKVMAGLKDEDSVKQVLSELSDLFPSLVDVGEMSSYLSLNNQDTERLHAVSKEWMESMSRTSDMNRELQAECQSSQNFQEKCEKLTRLTEKLVEEAASAKPQSNSCVQETLSLHQRLQAEIITGHQLLQNVLCDAFKSMEEASGEKRSELLAPAVKMRQSWFSAVTLVHHRRCAVEEDLRHRRIYRHGSKLLWKLLRGVDPLLPPAAPALCSLQQPRSCADDYQCVKESLDLHSTTFNQTLAAGKRLCDTATESECQSRLQSELQAVETSWRQKTSLLHKRKDLVHTTAQKWSQCQDGISNIVTELDDVKTRMKQQLPEKSEKEKEKLIQETELSLQCLATGLRELGTMKTDLSQYIPAGDSALLEQQLEQLHGQWEELCMKVSLRKQEIADRLNAWTIFNDKNKEFCDWLTQMENKVCHSSDQSIEEMVEKLKKDCMEEINLFSENKSHLKQLGEQLLLASDEAKQTQVHGSLQEVNQRWHNLFHHIEARVKKLKETLVTMQRLDKNMSNLRSWLSRIEAELSRPITYSVCHHEEIQRRLAEQQELQRDIEQHTEGIASVLSLCDVLLSDEDAAGSSEVESDSLQETSHSLDQRWRTICAMALDRRLRIEETWKLWCKFLDDYSRFEDWLKIAERTAANPNSAGVLYTVAKEELKKFEGFQRQVHERLTQLEIVNNQYRRLARENRTDRASQLKAMVHEGNRRWDTLHRRVAAILRRLKYFTSQREEFEGTRESLLMWLTELDLQLTDVGHFSESDVHHKIQQLNSFQKEITLNTERIDGLIVFGEGLIQRSSPQDAALIEEELEELYTYCQDVFSRLVRFHQRLSQPTLIKEPELSGTAFSLESSLELIGRSWLRRGLGSLPATPTHPLTSPLERSGCGTPVSVDSLPLEWDHTGDVGGSSSPEDSDDDEDDDEGEEHEEEERYFSALSVSSRSMVVEKSSVWRSTADPEALHSEGHVEAAPTFTSTPRKQAYLGLMSQCSGSIEDIKRVSLILDEEERQPQELGLTGLTASDKQSGVIERWELLQAQSRSDQLTGPQELQQLTSDLDHLTSWLESAIPELERPHCSSTAAASIADMEARARELKEMQRMFTHYKSIMLSVNLRAQEAPELQQRLLSMNRDWSRVCTGLQQWDAGLRKTLMRCQEFHGTLHSLLLWLAHAESTRYAVDISDPDTCVQVLQQHCNTLTHLQEELQSRQRQQTALQTLWSQLQPEDEDAAAAAAATTAEDQAEAQEKLHVTGSKLKSLLRDVDRDLSVVQQRLNSDTASAVQGQSSSAEPPQEKNISSTHRGTRESSPPRSFFYRVLRAAFPLHLLLLLLLLLPCLIPQSESDTSCTVVNNFARSFYPMLRYTNGPPPT